MDEQNTTEETVVTEKPKSRKLGIGLLIFSLVAWGLILAVPFLPVEVKTKIIISSGLAVIAEIAFWIGGILLGKEVVRRYRKQLNPRNWFKNKEQ
ncbi:transporter suffix domain-containing protein [Pseudalkalibacillus decolorationis]|uniref:transporter suffix domain-containing protein n=1 Tax=Pseudalkalibacillus decolorationis TaxID=163879 RepID=UPI0021480C7B|nr:transporter suffix domain-containing protein [Pseudalkalibacillus decolorationis]